MTKEETMKNILTPLIIVLAFGTGAAMAQTVLPEIADADGSGAWSLMELQTLWPDMSEEVFATLDLDANGSVEPAELSAALEAGTLNLPDK